MAAFGGAVFSRRTIPLVDVVSSKTLTISTWFRVADGEGGVLLSGGSGASAYVYLDISTSTGQIRFWVANSSGTKLWDVTSDDAYDDDEVHHLGISVSLGAGRGQFYVDAVSADITAGQALTDGTIAFTSADEWVVGGDLDLIGADPFVGNFYEIAFWPGVSLDFTDNDELQLIVAADSAQGIKVDPSDVKPVGYGLQGRYLDSPAAIILAGSFEVNGGVGGKFVRSGNVGEDPADEAAPSGYRFFPRWRTPGERWFPSEQSGDPYPRSQTFIEHREGLTSFGKRLGLDEMDAPTRRERPGFNFTDLVLGLDEEDDEEDTSR